MFAHRKFYGACLAQKIFSLVKAKHSKGYAERDVENRERARFFAIYYAYAKRASGFHQALPGHAGAGQAFPRGTTPRVLSLLERKFYLLFY